MDSELDVEAAIRVEFEPRIRAEVERIAKLADAARAKCLNDAIAELRKQLAPSPPTPTPPAPAPARAHPPSKPTAKAATRKKAVPPRADMSAERVHPVSRWWAQFTFEQRSAEMSRRRKEGHRRKLEARRIATPVLPKPALGRGRVVDLFCGAGGSTVGWKDAGYDVVLGVDHSQAALATYRANHGHDIRKLDLRHVEHAARIIASYRPDIIVGSPPCTDFSPAGKRVEGAAANLTRSFAEIVARVLPRVFVLENVSQVRRSRAYADACAILTRAGYGLSVAILDASRCGVPQRRRRLFLVGMLGAPDGWADLAQGLAVEPLSLRAAFGSAFPAHHYRHPCNSKRRAIFSAEEPSPTIRGTSRPVPPGYKRREGDTAPPGKVRALTSRERAAIQSFPADYRWCGTKTEIELQIGNAVPPKMASYVAEQVSRWLHLCNLADGHALAA